MCNRIFYSRLDWICIVTHHDTLLSENLKLFLKYTHLCETNSTVLLETWWAKILLEFSKPIYTVLNAVTVPLANSEAIFSCFWLFSSLCSIMWLKALVLNGKKKVIIDRNCIIFSRKKTLPFLFTYDFLCAEQGIDPKPL